MILACIFESPSEFLSLDDFSSVICNDRCRVIQFSVKDTWGFCCNGKKTLKHEVCRLKEHSTNVRVNIWFAHKSLFVTSLVNSQFAAFCTSEI